MNIIDEKCEIVGSILESYSCVLNQTDIENNKNKFYIMQIIETKAPSYELYTRYGRVGEVGKLSSDTYSNKSEAISFFLKQFRSKTGNTFGAPFTKKEGKYYLCEFEKPKDEDIIDINAKKNDAPVENLDEKLNDRLKLFLDLISNEKMLSDTLIKLNIDSKKMPLGKISNSQLEKAAELLKKLKKIIDNGTADSDTINQLCSDYYTLVPYSCGRNKPPLLEDDEAVDKCMALVDELKNVHITYNIIKKSNNINKLTNVYNQMNATISTLDKSSRMYTELVKYIANTQASTHNCNLQVVDIYQVNKNTDDVYDKHTKNMKNKMLLFHGSPIVNWCSIIKNGLLLDPSKLGVRITGKMFGYGIYWANAISKSFNYCGVDSTNNTAVVAVGEVALGEIHEQYLANYNLSQTHLDSIKKNSTHGKGETTPSDITIVDGIGIPNGKLTKTKDSTKKCTLLYDEFIIYDSNQYKIKYLIVIKNMR
jgi:predicted DNA-binding WGR domain protein